LDVRIVEFPLTKVAMIDHVGSPAREHDTVRKLVAWKLDQGLLDPVRHRHYGVHYTDPGQVAPDAHHVLFCLSVDDDVAPNAHGIRTGTMPPNRCALARDIGSRHDNRAAAYLWSQWLPHSGEAPGDYPMFFHYVNVGPRLTPDEMITDVYLPLRR